MARPLRLQYPGAYYHVMNRGNRREDLFVADQDRKVFWDALADSCETYHIKLISYVARFTTSSTLEVSQHRRQIV